MCCICTVVRHELIIVHVAPTAERDRRSSRFLHRYIDDTERLDQITWTITERTPTRSEELLHSEADIRIVPLEKEIQKPRKRKNNQPKYSCGSLFSRDFCLVGFDHIYN